MASCWKEKVLGAALAMLFLATAAHAEPVDVKLESLSAIIAKDISDDLMNKALAAKNKEMDVVLAAIRPMLETYLSVADARAAEKRFEGLLTNLLKDVPPADVLKTPLIKNLLVTAVQDSLKRDKLAERVEELTKSVDRINAGIKPKVIRANKEVDFLFAMEVDDDILMADGIKGKHRYCKADDIERMSSGWYSGYYIECLQIKDGTEKPVRVNKIGLSDDEVILLKMAAVEEVLGLRPEAGEKLVDRITAAQKEIRNYDWERNHLQFGVMEGYIGRIDSLSTSLVLHAYPSYRQYRPGSLDPIRRTSFFIGIGTASKKTDTSELTGPVYASGIGIALREGVGLTIGYSAYKMKSLATDGNEEMKRSFTFGVTLNQELWNSLFGGK